MKISDKQQKSERALQKAMAMMIASDYCEKNNLSKEKLSRQHFQLLYNSAIFAQPSDITPHGLINDMDTMPIPTLIIRATHGDISIEETEHTRKYLS